MTLITRRPTGLPAWRLGLIAGAEKCGKSYALAEASANTDIIHRTFWISFGEPEVDEYGAIPGANFEIVDLNNYGGVNYRGLVAALRAAIAEPPADDGRPNMIVVDGMGRLWDHITGQAQFAARKRLANRDRKRGEPERPVPEKGDLADGEATIHPDLWNAANDRWHDVIDLLRSHAGPVWVTALLKQVTAMENGQPTKHKEWKIVAQKNLAADCGVVVEVPEYREFYVTGVVSTRFEPVTTGVHTAKTRFADFTVRKLWDAIGLDAHSATGATATTTRPVSPSLDTADIDGTINPAEIENAIAYAAATSETPTALIDALRDVWTKYGEPAMHTPLPGGSTGADRITGLVNEAKSALAASSQTPPPANLPATPIERSREGEPNPAQDAAHATEQAVQAARAPRDRATAIILDEITNQAITLGQSINEYLGQEKAATIDQYPAEARAFAIANRPRVIAALREQGHHAQADAYEQAGTRVGAWSTLTKPKEAA